MRDKRKSTGWIVTFGIALAMLFAPAARADTVRARIVVDPPFSSGESGWQLSFWDTQGHSAAPGNLSGIPNATVTQSGGTFVLTDHDGPSTRSFCADAVMKYQGMLRPNFSGGRATASSSPTATVTVIDPDGTSRTDTSVPITKESAGGSTPASAWPCDEEGPPPPGCSASPGSEGGILGTPGADKLNGTPGNDCLYGEDGDDRLDGKGGEDTVNGGGGNDYVVGGAGRDVLEGGDGRDLLSDGLGANTYDAGPGDDVVSARQSIGEQIDCGPGRDLAIVDRKDHETNCEQVERPPSGERPQPAGGSRHGKKRALAAAAQWPPISHGWWRLPTDAYMWWAERKTSSNPYGFSCEAENESMIAGVAGAWTSGNGRDERRIEFQFRWIDISPADFDRLNWIQRMGQAVNSPEHKSPWTTMTQFYSTYNWRQRLPAGESRWVQARVKWIVNATRDKVKATDWETLGGACTGL